MLRLQTLFLFILITGNLVYSQAVYHGKYISGQGDLEYLELLDKAYRMTRPDAELENLSMLYYRPWNGFVEGPTWDAWWIQNSFGPTYTMLPFMDKAYQTFIANSQSLWFAEIGDGKRSDANGYVAPEGSLCDCARKNFVIYKQGDGRHKIHDWGFGFTTAGIILQAELLLIQRDMEEIVKYLPLLEQCADFIDTRRDAEKNIFLIGTAGNLLAPSYNGSGKELADGTFEPSYLAEISVNYIAALNRLIELEKMAGHHDKVGLYKSRLQKVKSGLRYFLTDEGYFIRSLDKDGTKHGLYGQAKHGYFEATPNHDALAFRVVDDDQAVKIYGKIKSIAGLRPHNLILPNYPSYDDMYETRDLFRYGIWVNGGHWTTCEARMQLGYYRANAFDDAKAGFMEILKWAPTFRLDNPLVDCGAGFYQPKQPINCVYDCWGAPGGFLRGLFEYVYTADGLRIYPHIPPGITQLKQNFPVYFGDKKIFIMTKGAGPITSILVNDKKIKVQDKKSFFLNPDKFSGDLFISLGLGKQPAIKNFTVTSKAVKGMEDPEFYNITALTEGVSKDSIDQSMLKRIVRFHTALAKEGLSAGYAYHHAGLILENLHAIYERKKMKKFSQLPVLAPESQLAADQLYIKTVKNLCAGLVDHLQSGTTLEQKRVAEIWQSN